MNPTTMTPINKYQDLEPFAGGVVAFETEACYKEQFFSFKEQPKTKYGILSRNSHLCDLIKEKTGYQISYFKKPYDLWINSEDAEQFKLITGVKGMILSQYLDEYFVNSNSLKMRVAFPNEVQRLQEAVYNNDAENLTNPDLYILKKTDLIDFEDTHDKEKDSTWINWEKLMEFAKQHFSLSENNDDQSIQHPKPEMIALNHV